MGEVLEPASTSSCTHWSCALTFNKHVEYPVRSILNKVVEDQVLDRTYAALADPTRRALLVALRAGDARISDLAARFPMTFAGVSRHVGVLETAGLVRREIRGREHWLSVRPAGLRHAERWINEQSSFWSKRADALAARLQRREHQE
jgi:DNA-binding transcriptional ArsR family regulator